MSQHGIARGSLDYGLYDPSALNGFNNPMPQPSKSRMLRVTMVN
jgi:hypothetical protein